MYFKPPLLILGLALSAVTFNANATLTSHIGAGNVGLVYSSVSDITWTQDANLFKTLYDANNNLINQLTSVTPSYNDTAWGLQTIDASDFDTANGRMTWWGGIAFVNYLNSINYGGSNQWRLPSAGSNPQGGYNQIGSELGQLFYSEQGGTAGNNIPSIFNNKQAFPYWSSTEYASLRSYAWDFDIPSGFQDSLPKDFRLNAWAVSSGQVTTVPVPGAVWLMATGLMGLLGLKRRASK